MVITLYITNLIPSRFSSSRETINFQIFFYGLFAHCTTNKAISCAESKLYICQANCMTTNLLTLKFLSFLGMH